MRIAQNTSTINIPNKRTVTVSDNVCLVESTHKQLSGYTYPAVYFCGKINPKVLKKINIPAEKESLLADIDEILKNDITEKEMTKEEKILDMQNRVMDFILRQKKKKEALETEIFIWKSKPVKNVQAYRDERNILQKKINRYNKVINKPIKLRQEKRQSEDTKTDFLLINKFKSAVLEDNFDLTRVYSQYYDGLNGMKTVTEIKQTYPKIIIPKNPRFVVAEKIKDSLTRDFYEELDTIVESGDKKRAKAFIKAGVENIIYQQLKKTKEEKKQLITEKLLPVTVDNIINKYRQLRADSGIASVPIARKQKHIISDIDKKMLSVDYDDFVLTTLRERYLGIKKPAEIVYTDGEEIIKISELSNSDYRFSKPSPKIQKLLKRGEELKSAQRDYDNFSKEEIIERLEFHADRLDSDEVFLDKLVSFSVCKFEPEDIEMVKKFLREGDRVLDGEQTLDEAVKNIHYNSIRPAGTERLNLAERQEMFQRLKAEQKQRAMLNLVQTDFDNNINTLYQNDMAYVAELCSSYRPQTNNANERIKAEQIGEIIRKYSDETGDKIVNKDRLAISLTRWNKYNEYKQSGKANEIIKSAETYAKDKDGSIDFDKAGKYIINAEAVMTYPQSFEFARNKKIANSIMEKFGEDKAKAIEFLCKFDDYLDLTTNEKSKVGNILKIFDKKDETSKFILKQIIKEDYIKLPTVNWAMMNESGAKRVKATIAPSAKEGILEYYKFPKCLDYFESFENALPYFAATRASAGIKKIDKNCYELKILDDDDRLLAYNGNYYFEKFDPVGLHKAKS